MTASVDEIADRIYRISTFSPSAPPGGITFNQFLIDDDEPMLVHTGHCILGQRDGVQPRRENSAGAHGTGVERSNNNELLRLHVSAVRAEEPVDQLPFHMGNRGMAMRCQGGR